MHDSTDRRADPRSIDRTGTDGADRTGTNGTDRAEIGGLDGTEADRIDRTKAGALDRTGADSPDRPEDRPRSVLVYDGDCPFCSAASSALRRVDDAGVVPWKDEAAQAFLDAQFGETPFVLAFVDVDAEHVWVGREAARELCERAGLPVLVGDVVGENYEAMADAVRRLGGADREPDQHHGAFPLTDAAAEAFPAVAARAEQTHRPRRP